MCSRKTPSSPSCPAGSEARWGGAAETESLQERFRTERQILANLDHPSIAKVLDGGVTEKGARLNF